MVLTFDLLKILQRIQKFGICLEMIPQMDFISVLLVPISKGKGSSAVIPCDFHHLSEASLHQQDETKINWAIFHNKSKATF